jgi:CysZ protein
MLRFPDQRKRLRSRRMLSLGFGGGSLLMTMIPVVNFFAMPASVAGATAMWVKEHRQPSPAEAAM